MAKKKLQDDVLFGEQDIITPEPSTTSSVDSPSTESSVDDAALRLLQTQEKLLSNYDLMQQKMDASEKQIARLLKTEDIHPPKTGISVHFSDSLT